MQLKSRKKNKHLESEKVNIAWCGLEIPLCIPFCFGCHKVTRVLKRGKQLKIECNKVTRVLKRGKQLKSEKVE